MLRGNTFLFDVTDDCVDWVNIVGRSISVMEDRGEDSVDSEV